nr:family 43 glycosylhydrolase [Paenibacillus terrae]
MTRATPGVESVTWLFDPAVLADEDGKAYIYFGGGVPDGRYEWPDTARVMELGEGMTSVVGEAVTIPAPYMFEDAGIHKYKGTYYYTYCSNFYEGIRAEGGPPSGEIAYMTSDKPMGPWTYRGTMLKNPGHFFGVSGNNHHAIFKFHEAWYIAYHAQTLSQALEVPDGYRSTHINRIFFDEANGTIQDVTTDYTGVGQVKLFNPYISTKASTIAWSAGVSTERTALPDADIVLAVKESGSWLAISGADFGREGAAAFTAVVAGGGRGNAGTPLGFPGWNAYRTIITLCP